jgi:putative FmdB family regulatory protein
MPNYDFECPQCKELKTLHIPLAEYGKEPTFCECGAEMTRVIGPVNFAVQGGTSSICRDGAQRWKRSEELKKTTKDQVTAIREKRAANQGKKFNPDKQHYSWDE